jgi:hypothetical protein
MSFVDSLPSLVSKKIRRVVYYYWHNVQTGEDNSLDWVEITYHDSTVFTIQRSEKDDNIIKVDFDLEKQKNELHKQYGGSFTISRYNATLDKYWFPVLDNAIVSASLTGIGSILLDFGDNHVVELSKGEEGIEIEFYE